LEAIALPTALLQPFSDAMSITKRYLTSLRSMRSYASLIYSIRIGSTSHATSCFPQKSSISCV
jgi:hypothetical protein